ncbi:MAG: transaldolase [Dehalococcoidia bacterium]
MATKHPRHNLQLLDELGQSAWLDYIRRGLLDSGEFEKMVLSGWIQGVTSNPTIFLKAIAGSHDYDSAIQDLREQGLQDPYEAFLALATEDLRAAADVLRPIYDRSAARDGYISFEAQSGTTEAMVGEARRAFSLLDRPNVLIKIPATNPGIEATRILSSGGINVNVTLLFDVDVYERVALAYIEGLEERQRNGLPLDRLASVASFFVSRVDTKIDALLPETSPLRGRVAVANAAAAYSRFRLLFSGPRWQSLADAGANVQRPLWASTGTKNPSYSDTLYVDELIGADTVNTMPEATLQAFLDHGRPGLTLVAGAGGVDVLRQAEAAGIDLRQAAAELLKEGLASFEKDFERLTDELRKKLLSPEEFVLPEAAGP